MLKGIADGLVHGSDAGAVSVGLSGPSMIALAAETMAARMQASGYEPSGFLVQAMAPARVELLVGAVADPTFGPVVASQIPVFRIRTEPPGLDRSGAVGRLPMPRA